MDGNGGSCLLGKKYEKNVKYKVGGITFNVKREYSDGKKMSELLTGYILKKENGSLTIKA